MVQEHPGVHEVERSCAEAVEGPPGVSLHELDPRMAAERPRRDPKGERMVVEGHALDGDSAARRPAVDRERDVRGSAAEVEPADRTLVPAGRGEAADLRHEPRHAPEAAVDEADEPEARLHLRGIRVRVVHPLWEESSLCQHLGSEGGGRFEPYDRRIVSDPAISLVPERGSRRPLLATILAALAVSMPAPAQAPPQPAIETSVVADRDLPWPLLLGARVAALERLLPVVEKVVLVPDEATFLAEISRWSLSGRWPVLLEDDLHAPRFIRRFEPRRVFRRSSVGELPAATEARRQLALDAIVRSFGGDPAREDLRGVYEASGFSPPGVVFTEFSDPAWLAAVALAAGRGQWLEELPGDHGGASARLDPAGWRRLDAAIRQGLDRCGQPYAELGDAIDAVTLCRVLPVKANADLPAAARISLPVPHLDPNADLAVTDLLGRHPDGRRYAVVSQVFGTAPQCVAAAMSALFLDRREVWMLNTYREEGDWGMFAIGPLGTLLQQIGYSSRTVEGADGEVEAAWLGFKSAPPPDLLLLNSSGDPDRMSLGSDRLGWVQDIPILDRPLALQMVHSFSLARPDDPETLGAAWLREGVYAYAGAVAEPFLAAFIPPRFLLERLANLVPFLVAARQVEGLFSPPWRVMTYGDPLMLAAPPHRHRVPRVPPPAAELVAGRDLRDAAKDSLRQASEAGSPEAFRTAMHDLVLLGRDEVAASLWRAAAERGAGPAVAPQAQAILFRLGDLPGFIEAWRADPAPSSRARTMLWQLANPLLAETGDAGLVMLLQQNLRGPRSIVDLERLAPALRRVLGVPVARRIVQRELDAAPAAERGRYQSLLDRLPPAPQ